MFGVLMSIVECKRHVRWCECVCMEVVDGAGGVCGEWCVDWGVYL